MRLSMFIVSFLKTKYISFIVVQSFKYFEQKKISRQNQRQHQKEALAKKFLYMESKDENDNNDDDNKNEPKGKRGKHVKHMGRGFGEQSKTASKMPAEVEAELITPKKDPQMVISDKNRKHTCSLSLESCILVGVSN
jgi:hypothetical protein